jgi:polysaccharide export outer membrane protein
VNSFQFGYPRCCQRYSDFSKGAAMKLRASVGVITLCAGLALNAHSEQAKPSKSPANNPMSGANASPIGRSHQETISEYRLGSEDLIECFVYKEPELTTTVVVRPDGMISLPLIGEIQATGKTAHELQAEIASKLLEFIAEPVVTVIVKEINSPKISVFGEVRKPDVFPIKQRMTVLNAIALAGGFTEFAKRDRVIVIRAGSSGQERIKLNLERLIKDGAPFYLQALDTVFVE